MIFLYLAPMCLGIPAVMRNAMRSRWLLHMLSLPGITALLFVKPLIPRLVMQSVCTALSLTASMSIWWHRVCDIVILS